MKALLGMQFPTACIPKAMNDIQIGCHGHEIYPGLPLTSKFLLSQVVTKLIGLGFGVLRLLDALGQILASVQLTAGSIVVPPQEILGVEHGKNWEKDRR